MCIWRARLHPSCALIVWLTAVLALQALGYAGALLMAGALMVMGRDVLRAWSGYVRRARWLLLTLWLILAYNVPGEAFQELAWAPTYEGIAEANLHALRLIVMLGCLAWLFRSLGRDGLVSGLWGLLRPFRRLGLDSGRLVVRLSLVLQHLQEPMERGGWRAMLTRQEMHARGPDILHIYLPHWAGRDSLLTVLMCAALLAVLLS